MYAFLETLIARFSSDCILLKNFHFLIQCFCLHPSRI